MHILRSRTHPCRYIWLTPLARTGLRHIHTYSLGPDLSKSPRGNRIKTLNDWLNTDHYRLFAEKHFTTLPLNIFDPMNHHSEKNGSSDQGLHHKSALTIKESPLPSDKELLTLVGDITLTQVQVLRAQVYSALRFKSNKRYNKSPIQLKIEHELPCWRRHTR